MRVTLILLLALLLVPATAVAAQREGCVQTGTAGSVQRWTCTTSPVEVGPYAVRQNTTGPDDLQTTPKPPVDGFITGMDVDVVGEDGRPIPIRRLMLHHIVFLNLGDRVGAQRDTTCGQFTLLDSRSKIPALAQRFYAAGEERAVMAVPPGYGLATKADDRWLLTWMFMNHRPETDRGWIRYNLTIDTAPRTPVTPYWLDVRDCLADPQYSVPGGGAPGSTHREVKDYVFPNGGRIVAAGGHVHGGAKQLVVSRPDCGDVLYRSRPAWGLRSHPFYDVEPVLHEPGPISMSSTTSQQGIPFAAGERVRLTSAYDGQRPHVRVMGITIAYVAEDTAPQQRCAPLPADRRELRTTAPHRTKAPVTRIPVSVPRGRRRPLPSGSTIRVEGFRFSVRTSTVRSGASLSWRFEDDELHDVTVAQGPRGFATSHANRGQVRTQRLTARGEYRWFCSLHPVEMTGSTIVR